MEGSVVNSLYKWQCELRFHSLGGVVSSALTAFRALDFISFILQLPSCAEKISVLKSYFLRYVMICDVKIASPIFPLWWCFP